MKSDQTISVSDFKAKALQLLDDVARSGRELIITRRGKPLARVSPYRSKQDERVAGSLADTLIFEGDIISPMGPDDWEAAK